MERTTTQGYISIGSPSLLASRPNPKRCADSPLTQPSGATNQQVVAAGCQQVQWAGVCDEHHPKRSFVRSFVHSSKTNRQTDTTTTFAFIYKMAHNLPTHFLSYFIHFV
jgi:hypothetical protein